MYATMATAGTTTSDTLAIQQPRCDNTSGYEDLLLKPSFTSTLSTGLPRALTPCDMDSAPPSGPPASWDLETTDEDNRSTPPPSSALVAAGSDEAGTPAAHECEQCGLAFLTADELDRHVGASWHYVHMRYMCGMCLTDLASLSAVRQHTKPVLCNRCAVVSPCVKHARIHARCHGKAAQGRRANTLVATSTATLSLTSQNTVPTTSETAPVDAQPTPTSVLAAVLASPLNSPSNLIAVSGDPPPLTSVATIATPLPTLTTVAECITTASTLPTPVPINNLSKLTAIAACPTLNSLPRLTSMPTAATVPRLTLMSSTDLHATTNNLLRVTSSAGNPTVTTLPKLTSMTSTTTHSAIKNLPRMAAMVGRPKTNILPKLTPIAPMPSSMMNKYPILTPMPAVASSQAMNSLLPTTTTTPATCASTRQFPVLKIMSPQGTRQVIRISGIQQTLAVNRNQAASGYKTLTPTTTTHAYRSFAPTPLTSTCRIVTPSTTTPSGYRLLSTTSTSALRITAPSSLTSVHRASTLTTSTAAHRMTKLSAYVSPATAAPALEPVSVATLSTMTAIKDEPLTPPPPPRLSPLTVTVKTEQQTVDDPMASEGALYGQPQVTRCSLSQGMVLGLREDTSVSHAAPKTTVKRARLILPRIEAGTTHMTPVKEKQYQCDECGQAYQYLNHLKNHIKTHTGAPFKCEICGATFVVQFKYERHVNRFHKGENPGSRPYRCPICCAGFKQRNHLVRHLRIHTGEKPYKCTICGTAFALPGNLSYHMRIHSNDKPYICDMCGTPFRSTTHLKQHFARIHRGLEFTKGPETTNTCKARVPAFGRQQRQQEQEDEDADDGLAVSMSEILRNPLQGNPIDALSDDEEPQVVLSAPAESPAAPARYEAQVSLRSPAQETPDSRARYDFRKRSDGGRKRAWSDGSHTGNEEHRC
ncbi:PREDICTED: transcription factor Sp4-like isoform X2 [Priapulus caudatus]|uniref:Transcription factor Sp4-like isoform X2 n=1 Tax=Priapulus caudatus TaxID=37621 RepID=A0ABM1EYH5_PRICU|nr:PREDICTED: transcription factor Sp4-like isoform X2 [Priapulus caudatus]